MVEVVGVEVVGEEDVRRRARRDWRGRLYKGISA
jgi:hypothetical protein